jgi:hypothetical protein
VDVSKRVGGVVLVIAVVVSVGALVDVLASGPGEHFVEGGGESLVAQPESALSGASAVDALDALDRSAGAAPPHHAEDQLSVAWDGLSSETRTRELRSRFESAVKELRRGKDITRNRARADDALSGLRAELYGTDSGRRAHTSMEQQLDAALRRQSVVSTASPAEE